ncbi:hypothetical protein FTO74_03865 [Granulicella sp. WH15]|uniref:TonB-dependent receptor n=1 Tax=Granulicella sp. WH15 TaxID=2602070 RepID=UPI001366F0A8|nr:TonB-dependent receptor [Granulicella sp. WH15]QHN02603.1 hypothetical protein FTO74_03865 [Granulicella sp. WH15]
MNLHTIIRSIAISAKTLLAVTVLFFSLSLFGQVSTGSLSGIVKDPTGSVLPDATVVLKNLGTGLTRTTTSKSDGSYAVPELPVGAYTVSAAHSGFNTASISGLTISVATNSTLDISLPVGSTTESVLVTDSTQQVDTTSPSLGGFVSPQRIEDLPLNGRNFVDLAFLQPGVDLNTNKGTQGGTVGEWFSSNGMPDRSNLQLLDGASVVSIQGGAGSSILSESLGVDGIQEFRVINGFTGAEYGGVLGAQLILVSKGGTNAFHGDVYDYLRNSALDAKYPILLSTQPKQTFHRNQFGGALGGPIVKGRAFFSTVFEALKASQPIPTSVTTLGPGCIAAAGAVLTNAQCPQLQLPASTPSVTVNAVTASLLPIFRPAGVVYAPGSPNQYNFTFNQPQNEYYGQARVDYIFGEKDTAFARFTTDYATEPVSQGQPYFYYNALSKGNIGTVSETHTFSSRLLNTIGFSYTGIDTQVNCFASVPGDLSILPGQTMGSISIPGVASFGPCSSDTRSRKLVYDIRDDAFYNVGRHSVKFGVLYNRVAPSIGSPQNARGGFTFPSLSSFITGNASTFTLRAFGPTYHPAFTDNEFGFYVQDDFKIWPRLTLNLGLRYEPWTVPVEDHGQTAYVNNIPLVDPAATSFTVGPMLAHNPSLKNFSPRIGLAWDVFGNGKTAFHAGYNRLYDVEPLNGAYNNYSVATPPFSASVVPTFTGQAAATFKLGLPVSALAANAAGTATIPFPTPSTVVSPSAQTIGHNLQQPTADEWLASVQQQLPSHTLLTLAYVGTRGLHLIQNVDINPNQRQIVDGQTYWPVGATRINPHFGSILQNGSTGDSIYHGMQVSVNRDVATTLQLQASYTWSRVIDNGQGVVGIESTATPLQPDNSYDPRRDRSAAAFNVTNNLRLNAIYRLPHTQRFGVVGRQVVNGWWISPILSAQSGLPFSPQVGFNNSRSAINTNLGNERPSYVTPENLAAALALDPQAVVFNRGRVIQHTRAQYFNPHMYTVGPAGFLGNVGRDSLYGPGLLNLDLSVVKDTKLAVLGSSGAIQFRAEFFNIINRENFAEPTETAFSSAGVSPTAGLITSLINPNAQRQIQLALKILF